MFFLQARDVQTLENFDLRTSELIFQGKRLIRNLSFSKQLRRKAIDSCREELDAGKFCILIESDADLTLWIEENESEAISTPVNLPPVSRAQPLIKPEKLALSVDFIEICRQRLTDYVISPIAEHLLQKTLKKHPQIPPELLVHILAAQIPDAQQAEKFRQSILASR